MFPEEFFDDPQDLWSRSRLDTKLLESVGRRPDVVRSDIEVAAALVRMIHNELEAFGTDGSERCTDDEIRLAIRVAVKVARRVGLVWTLPFSDFATFKSYWLSNGGHGSWQARRNILNDVFEKAHSDLSELEDREVGSTLVYPATVHAGTGWVRVDNEINELRRHFQVARTVQDYRNVGNDCVAVLERISEEIYDPDLHLFAGESEPEIAKTKQRMDRFVECAASGPDNAAVRKVAKAVIELAQSIKHRSSPTRRDAGIVADSVIQLANILRRLQEET